MAAASIRPETPLVLYALRRADDALILGHRLSEWCGHAPMLEEDMALANMGLDLLGQARELYAYAAKSKPRATTKTNSLTCAMPGNIAICCCWNSRTAISRSTMVRQFFYAAFATSIGAR